MKKIIQKKATKIAYTKSQKKELKLFSSYKRLEI